MSEGAPSGLVSVERWPAADDDPNRVNLSSAERLASAIGGGLLALWGLRRGSLSMILGGGALVYRAFPGASWVSFRDAPQQGAADAHGKRRARPSMDGEPWSGM